MNVDGLVSGLGTSDIISQLMQLERAPQSRLAAKKSATDKAITALQGLNTKFSALRTAAEALASAKGWASLKSTVSDPTAVGVAIGTTATAGATTFRVNALAAAEQKYSATTYAAANTAVAAPGGNITISYTDATGAPASLGVANHDGTLSGIAAAINGNAASPITAKVIKTTDAGDYRLELTAKKTGAASTFSVSGISNGGPDMAFTVGTVASDAQVSVGTSGTPLTITSASNTMTNIIPGVTVTLSKADPATAITVDIAADGAAMTTKISDFVDAANAVLKEVKALTDYNAAAKKSGLLGADAAVRRLASQILSDFSNAVGGATASSAGIQLDRNGLISLDKPKLEAAYAADPAKIQALFFSTNPAAPGIAQRLETTSDRADDRVFGVITNAIEGRRNQLRTLDTKIADWDVRLARKEAMLRRQFSSLETALGSSQSQGNWLAGQISGLPKWE